MIINKLFFTTFIFSTIIFSTRTEAQETASLSQIRKQEMNTIYQDTTKALKSSFDSDMSCMKARKLAKSGNVVTTVGAISIAGGLVFPMVSDTRTSIGIGSVLFKSGIAGIIVGLTLHQIGRSRMWQYDCIKKPILNLESSSPGVGVQLPESTTIYKDTATSFKSSFDFETSCNKARKLFKSGNIVTTVGAISTPVGLVFIFVGGIGLALDNKDKKSDNLANTGLVLFFGGITGIIVGVTLHHIGRSRISQYDCNKKPNLKLGSSSHGVGLQLTF